MGPNDLLRTLVEVFERLEIPYLVTGSVAAMAYGEPRLTNDIDVVAPVQLHQIDDLLASFPSSDYYLSKKMIQEAIKNKGQFNIIHPASGLKIDVVIPKDTPHDQSRFSRRRKVRPAQEYEAYFAAPEDVIIKKMEFYKAGGSEKHLRDITGILKVSPDDVDRSYITDWAEKLGVVEVWDAILKRLDE